MTKRLNLSRAAISLHTLDSLHFNVKTPCGISKKKLKYQISRYINSCLERRWRLKTERKISSKWAWVSTGRACWSLIMRADQAKFWLRVIDMEVTFPLQSKGHTSLGIAMELSMQTQSLVPLVHSFHLKKNWKLKMTFLSLIYCILNIVQILLSYGIMQ